MEDENQLFRDQEMIEIDRLIEYLDFENAKILLENKFKKEENNVQVIDSLSEVLLNLGDADSAIKLIKKSISIEPNKNGEKYMTIGQLSCGGKSTLKYYEKGVQVFISEIQNEKNEKKIIELKDSLASAYASIAELHMTTDLW
jgi:tetratricopeptide (TPR) repeat protein